MIISNKKDREYKKIIGFVVILLDIIVTVIVYLTGGVRYVFPHLMYIPIVICGFLYGLRYGLINAIICGLLVGPFMPLDTVTNEQQVFYNWISRLIIFSAVGSLSGLANNIFRQQKNAIQESFIIHRFSDIPNPNYLGLYDFSIFKKDVLLTTVLIHNFQKIVDTFSQDFHYHFLKEVYKALNENLKCEKIIISNNSDKFWIILEHTDINEMNDLLFSILKKDFVVDDIPVYFDFSMGYKVMNLHDQEVTTKLFNKTDLSAKKAFLEEKRFLISDENDEESYNYLILSEFKNALLVNETFLQFQPKVSLKTDELKLEALIRWKHPVKGLLPPKSFISHIEETKLINDLSIWVLKKVIEEIQRFESFHMYPEISFNISAKNLFNDEFIKQAVTLIDESGVDPSKIEFEITEHTIMSNVDKSKKVIQHLKAHGVKVAIDDFGRGFSSLSYLTILDIDYIKIDKSFIDNITINPMYQVIVQYTINLSHEIGYQVVCEGVETKEQFELLKAMNCDFIQGYYTSRPIDPDVALKWCSEQKKVLDSNKIHSQ
mgnify:CR=1 FL=1